MPKSAQTATNTFLGVNIFLIISILNTSYDIPEGQAVVFRIAYHVSDTPILQYLPGKHKQFIQKEIPHHLR